MMPMYCIFKKYFGINFQYVSPQIFDFELVRLYINSKDFLINLQKSALLTCTFHNDYIIFLQLLAFVPEKCNNVRAVLYCRIWNNLERM